MQNLLQNLLSACEFALRKNSDGFEVYARGALAIAAVVVVAFLVAQVLLQN